MLGRPKKDVPRSLDRITIPTTMLFGGIGDILGFHKESLFILMG